MPALTSFSVAADHSFSLMVVWNSIFLPCPTRSIEWPRYVDADFAMIIAILFELCYFIIVVLVCL